MLGYAIAYVVDFDSANGGLQYVTDEIWIGELGIHYKLALDGLNLFLILLTAILWFACTLWASFWTRAGERDRGSSTSTSRSRRRRCSAR